VDDSGAQDCQEAGMRTMEEVDSGLNSVGSGIEKEGKLVFEGQYWYLAQKLTAGLVVLLHPPRSWRKPVHIEPFPAAMRIPTSLHEGGGLFQRFLENDVQTQVEQLAPEVPVSLSSTAIAPFQIPGKHSSEIPEHL